MLCPPCSLVGESSGHDDRSRRVPIGEPARMADGSAIQVGALAPLTRPGWIEAGSHLLAGLELAAGEVNDAGGVFGRPLELVIRDSAGDPRRAAAAVDELSRLGVAALAGEYHSVVARAAAAKADAVGLPFLCSSAVLDALTEEPTEWVARLAPAQSHCWQVYADFLLGAGHRRIAVATEPSAYWASGARVLRDYLSCATCLSGSARSVHESRRPSVRCSLKRLPSWPSRATTRSSSSPSCCDTAAQTRRASPTPGRT